MAAKAEAGDVAEPVAENAAPEATETAAAPVLPVTPESKDKVIFVGQK